MAVAAASRRRRRDSLRPAVGGHTLCQAMGASSDGRERSRRSEAGRLCQRCPLRWAQTFLVCGSERGPAASALKAGLSRRRPARHDLPGNGGAAGAHNRREDHSTAASPTDTSDTTRPITHPLECCQLMIAAIRTPIPIMPAVATTRISGASSGRRFRRLGIITPGLSAVASLRSLRSARLASRSAPSCASRSAPGWAARFAPVCPSPSPGVTAIKQE